MSITILCPHCGHENHVMPLPLPTSINCDIDSGGCDKLFLYSAKTIVTHQVTIFKLPEPELVLTVTGGAA